MKLAADFRSLARNALSGRWAIAVIAGLIASLFGAAASREPEITFNTGDNSAQMGLEIVNQQINSTSGGWNEALAGMAVDSVAFIILAALTMAVVYFILSSVVRVGYSRFNMDLVDHWEEPEIGALFRYFKRWKTISAASLLQGLYVLLWSLLFVIPGIIASYNYAMTSYILAEHPELTANEAIEQSKQIMIGNRRRLFWLRFSFIGWDILATLAFGVGHLWLTPYKRAAEAAFFRDVSGTGYTVRSYETFSANW